MFNQQYFNDIGQIVVRLNAMWKALDGKNLVSRMRVNIITRDGKTFAARFNPGAIYPDPDMLHMIVYDEKSDESRLACIPFHTIERVEVFDTKPGAAGKKVGFQMQQADSARAASDSKEKAYT